jgi:CBS domain-containing protein
MSSPVYVVKPNDTLAHARNLMLKKDIGRLVVVNESEKPVGVITMTDIIDSLYGSNYYRPLDDIKVSEAMSKNVITIDQNKSLRTAASLMIRHKVGGLPVVDKDGKLAGIITRTDVVRAYGDRYEGKLKVLDVMRTDFPKASPTHSIYYLAKLIESSPVRKVVIVDSDGRPIGVVSKKDLAFAYMPSTLFMARGKDRYIKNKVVDPLKDKIVSLRSYLVPVAEDIMSKELITARGDEDSAAVARSMSAERIGCVPVIDDSGKLIGIVTKQDIVQLAARVL